jgi:hypothetical protein
MKEIRKENIKTAVLFSDRLNFNYCIFIRLEKRVGFCTAGLKILLTDKAVKTGVPSCQTIVRLQKQQTAFGKKRLYGFK